MNSGNNRLEKPVPGLRRVRRILTLVLLALTAGSVSGCAVGFYDHGRHHHPHRDGWYDHRRHEDGRWDRDHREWKEHHRELKQERHEEREHH
ncbi:MAG: hypothetical protein M1457_14120 [bacterium]|nr:hypothetical protein [bacterium]